MQKYKIEIEEKLIKILDIETNTAEEAIQQAKALYKNEDVVLSYENYNTTSFDISNEDKSFQTINTDDYFYKFLIEKSHENLVNMSKEELAKLSCGSLKNAIEEFNKRKLF